MLRRPFHWFVNKHGVHTFSNDQHTTQSLCTSGQPTSRAAPERHYEATQLKRDVS